MVWVREEYDKFVESEIEKDGARGKERWLVECSDCGSQGREYSYGSYAHPLPGYLHAARDGEEMTPTRPDREATGGPLHSLAEREVRIGRKGGYSHIGPFVETRPGDI